MIPKDLKGFFSKFEPINTASGYFKRPIDRLLILN